MVRLSRFYVETYMKFRWNLIAAVGQISHSFPGLTIDSLQKFWDIFQWDVYGNFPLPPRLQPEKTGEKCLAAAVSHNFGNPITSETMWATEIKTQARDMPAALKTH